MPFTPARLPYPLPRHRNASGRSAIVGMMGYAQSGKDTVAARLVAEHGFRRYAFADALKRVALGIDPIVSVLDDFTRVHLSDVVDQYGWEAAKRAPEVRRVLQHTGMVIRDTLGADTWVKEVTRKFYAEDMPIVVTDVRFPNEVDAIRRKGGILVRVVRPGTGPVNAHASETAVDDVRPDWTFTNDSTIEALHASVDAWYAEETS